VLPYRDAVEDSPTRGRAFATVITVLGLGVLLALIPTIDRSEILARPQEFWLFAALALVGELLPIRGSRGGEVEEIAVATTFGMAVLFQFGTGAAVAVFVLASVVADLAHGKTLWKVAFNAGQYALSVAVAGAVYTALGAPQTVTLEALGPMAAASATFFLLNDVLTSVAIALVHGLPIVTYVREDFVFQAMTAAALCAMAPVVLVLADRDPFLVPLVIVPVAAVYWGATASLHNTELVRRLEKALEQEKELGRLKDDFVAVVSHELRTPLTSIQGYIKTLLQLREDLGEEQRRSFLEAADRQSERLRRLIEQLLVVARLESHVEPLTLSLVSVGQIAKHVVDELHSSARGHAFDLRFDAGLPLVETDEAKVHQILSNLVENALKYSPPDTRLTIRGAVMGDGLVVSVEDEGAGIPEDAQDRIFERFYQVDSSATRRVGGTGLGLYICRKMSDAIGGRLWLERSGPEGTVFRLWVPEHPSTDTEEGPAVSPARVFGKAEASFSR
jgi:signal transduction histidine kinase